MNAAAAIERRNGERYEDLSARSHLLQREKVSLPAKIRQIWHAVCKRSKVFFHELFGRGSSRAEQVTGFLALLELVRQRRVTARQERPFAPIAVELDDNRNGQRLPGTEPEITNEEAQGYN